MAQRNDEPLEEPFVRAVVVAGDEPGTEAIHVMIAWDDLEDIERLAQEMLPDVVATACEQERFGGAITFVVPSEFLADTKANRVALARLEERLVDDATDQETPSGQPIRITVKLGVK
jgi:hypothetical protein